MKQEVVCEKVDECGNTDCDHAEEHIAQEQCKLPCSHVTHSKCVEKAKHGDH